MAVMSWKRKGISIKKKYSNAYMSSANALVKHDYFDIMAKYISEINNCKNIFLEISQSQ